jgi:hypothetical protein
VRPITDLWHTLMNHRVRLRLAAHTAKGTSLRVLLDT